MRQKKVKSKKYVMFIDETGDHKFNSSNSYFTLTGVVFEYGYAVDESENPSVLERKLSAFKDLVFGSHEMTLHLTDISNGRKEFSKFDKETRKKFYDILPQFIDELDFSIISITVDKQKLDSYYEPSKDPYIVAFNHVLQNFYTFIKNNNVDTARIVIESRDDYSNLSVQKAFFDVFNSGTTHLNIEEDLRGKIKGFIISKKNDMTYKSGLEIADILGNPLSRVRRGLIEFDPKCMKKDEYGKENRLFTVLKPKIFCPTTPDDIRNWGFKKVPIIKKPRPWVNNPR